MSFESEVAYFDHAASTPVHPEVVEAMRAFFDGCYANPTGAHRMARQARRATDDARDVLADALGARPGEIVFCGSGTEANNLAIFGAGIGADGIASGATGVSGGKSGGTSGGASVGKSGGTSGGASGGMSGGASGGTSGGASAGKPGGASGGGAGASGVGGAAGVTGGAGFPRIGGTVVCGATEHPAVLRPVERLGGRVVSVDCAGAPDLDALARALDDDVRLVSVMLANNETGVVCSLDDVAEVLRRHAPRALLHTDAVQAFPWLDVATLAAPADLISISAHKFGGPKGVGALVVRDGVALQAQLVGGGQEAERRSGTLNVAGIVGMGRAAQITVERRPAVTARVARLRDRLADGLRAAVPGTVESGVQPASGAGVPVDRSGKVAGSCHVCFDGTESEALLFLAEREGVYASAASACASGAEDPSHVLAAMGYPRSLARGSVRLSLGAASSDADVDRALDVLPRAVAQLRRAAA